MINSVTSAINIIGNNCVDAYADTGLKFKKYLYHLCYLEFKADN